MKGEQAIRLARERAERAREEAAHAAVKAAGRGVAAGLPRLLQLLAPGGVHRAWSAALLSRVVSAVRVLGDGASTAWGASLLRTLPGARAAGLGDADAVLAALDRAHLGARWARLWAGARPPAPARAPVALLPSPGYREALASRAWETLRGVPAGTPLAQARPLVARAVKDAASSLAWVPVRDARYLASSEYNRAVVDGLRRHDRPGSRMYKRLVATHDKRTGKDSLVLDGQTVPLDQPFQDFWYGGTYPYPPNRLNDREVVTPWRDLWGAPPRTPARARRPG